MITLESGWKYLTSLKLSDCIPTPDFCFSLAPYPFTAALIGAGYGGIGQILSPQKGLAPLPYAICFEVAYYIKQCFYLLGHFFNRYLMSWLKEGENQDNQKTQEGATQKGGIFQQVRSVYHRGIQLQADCFQKFDGLFSRVFRVRSYEQVHSSCLPQASWVEVCRHRFWEDMKVVVINAFSLSLAYQLCDCIGLLLPYRNIPFLALIIQSIAFEIFIMPALFYLYHRARSYIIEKANQETGVIAAIARCYQRVPKFQLSSC